MPWDPLEAERESSCFEFTCCLKDSMDDTLTRPVAWVTDCL